MHLLFLLVAAVVVVGVQGRTDCRPIYVRWPRVRLTFRPRVEGPYSLAACRTACSNEEHPARSGYPQRCAGFNQKQGPNDFAHDCQIYEADQLQNVDGFAEADDRYSFYWKYCVQTDKTCTADYSFTFFSDRYMDSSEISRIKYTTTLEDCLAHCLNEPMFTCRSVSFNRTDGGCHLSAQNQLSKPKNLRLNHNPNFRIDYFENNCYNISDSFTFDHECRDDGILVKVNSKFPYTGALYGLYDYFTCRIEPAEQREFSYFFPSPSTSKNCSDSIRYKGNDMLLEVVLSTDGVEPLYFITPEDLTYQARCQSAEKNKVGASIDLFPAVESTTQTARTSTNYPTSSLNLASIDSTDANSADNKRNGSRTGGGTRISVFVELPKSSSTSRTPDSSWLTSKHQYTTTLYRSNEKASTSRESSWSPSTHSQSSSSSSSLSTSLSTASSTTDSTSTSTTASTSTSTTETSSTSTSTTPSTPTSSRFSSSPTTRTSAPRWSTETTVETTTKDVFHLPSLPPKTQPSSSQGTTETGSSTTHDETTTATTSTTTTTAPSTTATATEETTTRHNTAQNAPTTTSAPTDPILFDIFNHGQPVEAVVVGSRVTLSFTPYYAIPPSYMTITGCQVEPVGSLYEWEKDPLPIVKDGCQSDHVGLVCPPERTDFGIRVTVEAFRYQTTAQVQYSCLVRVCPFAPCPQVYCPAVEGCSANPLLARNFGFTTPLIRGTSAAPFVRAKRQGLTIDQLRAALAQQLGQQQQQQAQNQFGNTQTTLASNRPPAALQQYLVSLGGDHIVKKRLIVVNSENELQYYIRTGNVPQSQSFAGR
uniref:Uncharacterized protein n=1 Tax=Plectus sambesii TaxID=2011161 RepID=A0A914X3B6_9BILA